MGESSSMWQAFISQPLVLGGAIVALIVYRYAAARIRRLPVIPLGLFILYLLLRLVMVALPERIEEARLYRWAEVIAAILLYCAIVRLLFALLVDYLRQWRKKPPVPKITRDFVLLAAYALIAIVMLRTRGNVNLLGLVTTSAVLTAILGLAAQNTLGNLFAGLSIQMERPYRIGDWIRFGDQAGRVVAIGWKSTRIHTFEDELVFIPNLDIAKSTVKNYSRPTPRHIMRIEIGVEYGAAPDRVRQVLLDIVRQDRRVLKIPPPDLRAMDYDDFAIRYQLRFAYEDYGISQRLKADITNRIWYALRRAGIRIPFPIRDVHHRHVERQFETRQLEKIRERARLDLDRVPILEPLSSEERAKLAQGMAIEEYGDGEVVVRQGKPGDSLYIVHRGNCDVMVQMGEAPPSKVATLAPPAFFGEMSLLTGEARTATVQAKGEITVFSIGKGLFSEILAANPGVSDELAKALAKRQNELAELAGRQREDEAKQASRLVKRIKAFFGIR